jgi:glycosyltransferase involved in cell wall biosynthesis
VVTDVGDAALIVGETGVVVPTKDPAALAAGWRRLLDLDVQVRVQLGSAARQRVTERYNLPEIVSRYERLFEELAGKE